MILRWIYNIWNFLLKTVAFLLLFIVLIAGLFLAAIQLPASKDHLKMQLENAFNQQFAGTAEVESIQGFIPFRTQLNNVILYSPDPPYPEQVHADAIYASIDLWALITGNIKITALDLNTPTIHLTRGENGLLLTQIFATESDTEDSRRDADIFFQRFSIFAPEITITDGYIEADSTISFPAPLKMGSPFIISGLNAEFFLESDEDQQFVDITSLTAYTNDPDFTEITLSGQFFNDGHFLELNGMDFRSDKAAIQLSAVASPVNLYAEDVASQLNEARYQLDMQRLYLQPSLLHRINPDFSKVTFSIDVEGKAEGNLESLFVDNLQISTGESFILADGKLIKLADPEFRYDLIVNNMVISESDLNPFLSDVDLENISLSNYGTPTMQGKLNGSFQELSAVLDLQTDQGNASIDGEYTFSAIPEYDLQLDLDSLDISPFFNDSLGTSILFGQVSAKGRGLDRNATLESSFNLSNSRIQGHTFNQLVADLDLDNRSGAYALQFRSRETEGSANGNFVLGELQQQFSTEAVVQQLDITTYFPDLPYESTEFNGRISANIEGSSYNDLYGRLSLEINQSIIDGDTLRPHQFYADINEPGGESRTLRLTSSFFDADLSGSIYPEKLAKTRNYWQAFFSERLKDEFFLEDHVLEVPATYDESAFSDSTSVDLALRATAKDLKLLQAYFPNLSEIESSATLNLNIHATADALSLNGSFFDDSLTVEDSSFDDLGVTINGIFNFGEKLRNNSQVDFQINTPDLLLKNKYRINGTSINLSLRDSIITIRQQIDNALENLSYYGETTTVWHNDRFETNVDTLSLGSSIYKWTTVDTPSIVYYRRGALKFNQFSLISDNDYFEVDGTFSSAPEDSVNYNIRNFSLARVSDLIGGRIQFEGIVDGDFTTRALTQIPSIQGDISITDGRINNRVIGDVSLRSRYQSETDRFDTEVHVYTDPDRYADYLEANNGIGHDLFFSGYFKTPDNISDEDEDLYYFDADLRQIDMWIVSFIVPNIITEMEGSSSGSGFIRGGSNDYDFEAVFDIDDVFGRPMFTNVPYTLNGNLIFNRSDGLLFENIILDDRQGGRGNLTGQVDLDDFSPLNFFDLRLRMNNLRFMNNIQDPNVPFFANLYGSGTAVLEGTSAAPVIRSATPILLSSNSRISIPLQDETELEQDRRFIQFVESFEDLTPLRRANGSRENGTSDEVEETELTFLELFTMNVQFITNDPVSVQLIFDPVTNDILTATGTGQIRLILDDQDFSMYGRFNISGGEYQFVGGDIFTRRFDIQDGGSISWQGDLTDANLNVTASYRARPDISTLTGTSFQRIPIELILQITGTISEISNEFYFQIPTGIEGTQDPTIAAQINRINQNEDEKVLQAFGILLTGNFVPSNELQNPELGNVTGTNALVNPLVSSQIISPLLSNQINSLLRSDITFDVDFNLNAFNEVDLGVALRLFNDRIVLRREGQITGDTEIGDLGATYRINRTFSITAFHRQDPTLSNRAETEARQTQEMNGIGVEAQFQFNTWQKLKNRISGSIRNLFGLKEKEPDVEEDETDPVAEI